MNLNLNMRNYNSMINIKSNNKISKTDFDSNLDKNKHDDNFLINDKKQLNKKQKIKHFLEESKFSSEVLIQNSLKIGKSFKDKNNIDIEFKKKKMKKEIIKEIEEKAKLKYIVNESEKNKKNLNEEFQDILDKGNNQTRIKLEKYFDDLISLKNEETQFIIENKKLEKQIEIMSNEFINLKQKLKEKNDEIDKIIKNLDKFYEIKPFFGLISQYPDHDPKQIMEEFFSNKQNLIDQLDKLNKANKEIDEIKKIRIKEKIKQNDFKENIIEKINEEKETFFAKNIIIEQDILNHERQYNEIKKSNLEQIKYKRLLVNLYKAIIKYIPDESYKLFLKEIGYNPISSEEEIDFSIFSNKIFINLIKDCITNKVSQSIESKLLRNTINFGNYLARIYLEKNYPNENFRYNPVKTFKYLKTFYDKNKINNYSLKRRLQTLLENLKELKYKKKKLKNILNQRKLKYLAYLDKLELLKQRQKNNIKINDFNSTENIELKHLFKEKKKRKSFSSEKSIEIIDNNYDKIALRNLKNNNDLTKNNFFITDINKLYKKNKAKYKRNIEKENYEQKKYNLKENKTLSSLSENKKRRLNKNMIKIKSLLSLKKFQLSLSNNKDKIFKNNGIKRGYEINENLNKLIKLLVEEKNFGNLNSKNKNNKLRIKIDDYFPLNNTNEKNKNRIIKKNKTEIFLHPNYKEDKEENNNNYEKISRQILTDIDNIIISIKKIGKITRTINLKK